MTKKQIVALILAGACLAVALWVYFAWPQAFVFVYFAGLPLLGLMIGANNPNLFDWLINLFKKKV